MGTELLFHKSMIEISCPCNSSKGFTHSVHCSSRGFQGYQRLPSQLSISHLFTLPSCSFCNTSKHGWIPNASGDTYTKDSKHFHFWLLQKCVRIDQMCCNNSIVGHSMKNKLIQAKGWSLANKYVFGSMVWNAFFLLIYSNIYKNCNSHIQ